MIMTSPSSPSTVKQTTTGNHGTKRLSTKSRVSPSRAGESVRDSPRNEQSTPKKNQSGLREGSMGLRRVSREYSTANEVRTERVQTTTREKVHVKTRPAKESPGGGNRRDWD